MDSFKPKAEQPEGFKRVKRESSEGSNSEFRAMKEINDYVREIRSLWTLTGCSIILDGWTNTQGQTLVNVLTYCPKGTIYLSSHDISDYMGIMERMVTFIDNIILDIGVSNVVQIISFSDSAFMRQLGQIIEGRYRTIFWTMSTSCCIEIMLKRFESLGVVRKCLENLNIITDFVENHPYIIPNGNALVPSSKLKSTLPFLTLENIVLQKQDLKNMPVFPTVEGERVIELIRDRSFWKAAFIVVKAVIPLVRVMELVHEVKANIGYIYDTIDQAKEIIKSGLKKCKESEYKPFWKVIDDVWDEFLYSSIHSASYYLNPNFFYSNDLSIDPEIANGLLCYITRATNDFRILDLITKQLEDYRKAKGAFDVGYADLKDKKHNIPPALWWSKYGGDCPELQKVAIRLLSQTCDNASKFTLRKSFAEKVLNESNIVEQQRLSEKIFLHYNMKLRNFISGISGNSSGMQ